MKKNKGFTLIELMVAVAIGAFMLGVMAKVLIDMKKTSITQSNIQKIQNDSNYTIAKIERDIRNAGFRGCTSAYDASLSWVNYYNATTSNYLTSMVALEGNSGSGSFSPTLDSYVAGLNPNNNFDVLTVRESTKTSLVLNTAMVTKTDNLVPSTDPSAVFSVGDLAIISSCSATTLFKVGTVSTALLKSDNGAGINYLFDIGAQINNYQTITYFVQNDGSTNNLYRQNGTAKELIFTNIDKFKVYYGIDSDGDNNVDIYNSASSISNFNKVMSVKVGIVLKGDNKNTVTNDSTYSYSFFGQTITPNDSIIRKVIYLNVSLRNKLP